MGISHMQLGSKTRKLTVVLHSVAVCMVIWRLFGWCDRKVFGAQTGTDLESMSRVDEHATKLIEKATQASNEVRVYVYELPAKYNRLQVAKSHQKAAPIRDPYCDENFYSAEVTVHEGLLRSKARTTDANKADLFYVPIYVTCFLINNHPNNLTKSGLFFDEAMQHVMHKYPYFNRSQGRDHVYTFAQGFGARLAGENWRRWRSGIFLTHNGDFFSEEYVPRKDVVIPPDLSHYVRPVYGESGGDADGDAAGNDRWVIGEREFLAHFGGQSFSTSIADHRGQNYSGGVRQVLVQEMYRTRGFRITGTRSEGYKEDMQGSIFCLAPEGWHPWSPRPYYGFLLGCVPVVLSERQELAFEDEIAYDDLVVWMRPDDVRSVSTVLRAIPGEEILRKLRAMERLWRLFWYGDGGLALDMIVRQLARHKYGTRPRHRYRHA
eukprot:gb/GEZJ01002149.1/.p1 GENE.gb/GEZJ01002149.1/~~gb/GEZJ01002149.1/.p1  ORF type:complete len:435 (-),score=35.71 gb/GEZJ01002149.1/:132-1436(-)